MNRDMFDIILKELFEYFYIYKKKVIFKKVIFKEISLCISNFFLFHFLRYITLS